MNHSIDFIDCNIVIVANTFKLNILNPVWMYKNKIFPEKELQGATCLPVCRGLPISKSLIHPNYLKMKLSLSN